MAQLAVALSEMGFEVGGSDKEFYEPMAGLLARSNVRLFKGFDRQNIASDAALVVVGNAVVYENPEVQSVEERGLPYTLFPRLLFDSVIKGKHSIVISGTHGKTTTSAMGAFVLEKLGCEPSYFCGGIVHDLPSSLRRGAGAVSIVEGDEYDSAFFAKVPKFSFYAPDTLVVTSIEFDHADIYPDLKSINREFTALVTSRPPSAAAVICVDDPNLRVLAAEWRVSAQCRIITYGEAQGSDWQIVGSSEENGRQHGRFRDPQGKEFEVSIQLAGAFNLKNALSVIISLERAGVETSRSLEALRDFRGVRRRQEIRAETGGITLIEDFAHHPTAVRETVRGLRSRYPGRRLVAVFEPRSTTSRRRIFRDEYVQAFSQAHEVVLCKVVGRSLDSGLELLDVGELAEAIKTAGVPARAIESPEIIYRYLTDSMKSGDVVLVMSNGSFGGLIEKLIGAI